jgi:hypothetical protein
LKVGVLGHVRHWGSSGGEMDLRGSRACRGPNLMKWDDLM